MISEKIDQLSKKVAKKFTLLKIVDKDEEVYEFGVKVIDTEINWYTVFSNMPQIFNEFN